MINLLNLMLMTEEETPAGNSWYMWIILGVVFVALILMMVIPNRRNKKKAKEMMDTLEVGSEVTTIGGMVGTVVELDERNVWIQTGTEENPTIMKFIRQAIYTIHPKPGSPEAIAQEEALKSKEDDANGEIK